MTSLFGASTILVGLAAIAGGLYLLQRLRVRHRPVRVISTLFWRAAVEEARARVLVERFRHPLIYLFLLAICALLWFAATGLESEDRVGPRHVILLDGSASMGAGDRFDRTRELAIETVAELPRARRQVIFCAGELETLLAPGEPARLFAERSAASYAEAAPSSIEAVILSLLPTFDPQTETTLWIASDRAVSEELRATLPAGVTIAPLVAEGDLPVGNRAITACGVASAASGNWEQIDLLVEVTGPREGLDISASLDGQEIASGATRSEVGGRTRFLFTDLPAAGGRFEVRLGGIDPNPLDDGAVRILPVRRVLAVELSASLAPWLEPVLTADPAVRIVSSEGDIAVRRSGDGTGAGLPALEFVTRDDQEESILLTHDDDEASADVLEHALLELGLDQVDAMELAAAAGRPITLGARPDSRRSIGVWEELLADEYNFISSRSFPLFVALSLRWILEVDDFPAEIVAGRTLETRSTLSYAELPRIPREGPLLSNRTGPLRNVPLDPVGAELRPPRAGPYFDRAGTPVEVSLLESPAASLPLLSAAALAPEAKEPPGGTSPLATLFAIGVLALLTVEWYFHRRGEVP